MRTFIPEMGMIESGEGFYLKYLTSKAVERNAECQGRLTARSSPA